MSLQEKVLNLKLEAALAVKHAQGWQRLIDLYGEEKATAFYKHLGLNHLDDSPPIDLTRSNADEVYVYFHTEKGHTERKSIEWEGLTLSREPKEHEKIAVKGIASAQQSAKESIGKVLLSLREELINDGLKGIKKLKPANYHELTLQASSESRSSLRDRLISVHRKGRLLVERELGDRKGVHHRYDPQWVGVFSCAGCAGLPRLTKEALVDDEFDDLDDLTDLTDARIANDVQSRIIAAATRFRLLGLTGQELLSAIQNEITAGTVTYIDRAATGLANKVINIGRMDEASRRRDEWSRVEYSALLDQNVCGPCAAEDGQEASNEADLTPTPNPECEGGDWCRCFHVYVQD